MRSPTYYIFILSLAGGLVTLALAPGFERRSTFLDEVQEAREQGQVFLGQDLTRFIDGPHTTFEFIDVGRGRAVMGANRPVENTRQGIGVLYFLPAEFMNAFVDGGVRVSVRARAVAQQPSREFWIALITADGYDSGWRTMPITTDFELHTFEARDLPARFEDAAFLRIWPDASGLTGLIEIDQIRFEHATGPRAQRDAS